MPEQPERTPRASARPIVPPPPKKSAAQGGKQKPQPAPNKSVPKRPAPTGVLVSENALRRTRAAGSAPLSRRTEKPARFVFEVRRDPVRKPFPFAIIFCLVVIVAVSMYVLSLRISVDNYTSSISQMESEIAALREEENALEVRLNAKYDLAEIERIATQEYGMVSRDSLQKRYVTISGEDAVEVIRPGGSADTGLLSSVAGAVAGLLA